MFRGGGGGLLIKMMHLVGAVLLLLLMQIFNCSHHVYGLSMFYYTTNCPLAVPIVQNTVFAALQSDPTLAAGLIRMHFHDCFIQVPPSIISPYNNP